MCVCVCVSANHHSTMRWRACLTSHGLLRQAPRDRHPCRQDTQTNVTKMRTRLTQHRNDCYILVYWAVYICRFPGEGDSERWHRDIGHWWEPWSTCQSWNVWPRGLFFHLSFCSFTVCGLWKQSSLLFMMVVNDLHQFSVLWLLTRDESFTHVNAFDFVVHLFSSMSAAEVMSYLSVPEIQVMKMGAPVWPFAVQQVSELSDIIVIFIKGCQNVTYTQVYSSLYTTYES